MVTAEKERERVTQNVSWFCKATFVELSGDQETDDQFPDCSTTERLVRDCEDELLPATGPILPEATGNQRSGESRCISVSVPIMNFAFADIG
ncbi:hypothetical protein NDU88_005798 [Pleurodeles waltl]|uniref:Uncharacterized protein n=1 Tax=Pleurodeles waltl TaxID=8319 RepID=A0AAV7TVA6_PLEWA|nr:hypothetical protein NDU88_005798 [Pleurodeles waltl]